MKSNYQIALVFGFLALFLLWGICLHGPAEGPGAPRVTEDRIIGADD